MGHPSVRFIIVLVLGRNIFFWKKFEEQWNYFGHVISLLMYSQNCLCFSPGTHRQVMPLCFMVGCWLFSSSPDCPFCIVPGPMRERNSCRMFPECLSPRMGLQPSGRAFVKHVGDPVVQYQPHKANNFKYLSLNPSTTSHWLCDLKPVIHLLWAHQWRALSTHWQSLDFPELIGFYRTLRTVPDAMNAQAVFADSTDGILWKNSQSRENRKADMVNRAINAHDINNTIKQEQEMKRNLILRWKGIKAEV